MEPESTARYPVPTPSTAHPSPEVHSPGSRIPPDPSVPRMPPPRWRLKRRVALWTALGLGVCVILLPALRTAMGAPGLPVTPGGLGHALGRVLLEGGLPPADTPLWGNADSATEETVPHTPAEPESPAEPDGSQPWETDPHLTVTSPDTDPSGVPTSTGYLTAPADPPDGTEPATFPDTDVPSDPPPTGGETAVPPEVSAAPPESDSAVTPNPDSPNPDSPNPDSPNPDSPNPDSPNPDSPNPDSTDSDGSVTPLPDAPPADTSPGIPEGCVPILSADLSETGRGSGYIINTAGDLPPSLPPGELWPEAWPPAVLLVHTHPYEGYGAGEAYYDPAAGSFGRVDSPNCPDGVVALGTALAHTLRSRGITVIHLRVAVTAGETATVIYDRTEAMIRYYCRLYPDIGLVLDLRRSAELFEGGLLRTQGQYRGESCAQLRVTVNGGRSSEALGRDLAVALALREGLWQRDPTVSRPVRVRGGGGLIPELEGVRVLTLELGAAGNTYAEAARLVPLLGNALGDLVPTDEKSD